VIAKRPHQLQGWRHQLKTFCGAEYAKNMKTLIIPCTLYKIIYRLSDNSVSGLSSEINTWIILQNSYYIPVFTGTSSLDKTF